MWDDSLDAVFWRSLDSALRQACRHELRKKALREGGDGDSQVRFAHMARAKTSAIIARNGLCLMPESSPRQNLN